MMITNENSVWAPNSQNHHRYLKIGEMHDRPGQTWSINYVCFDWFGFRSSLWWQLFVGQLLAWCCFAGCSNHFYCFIIHSAFSILKGRGNSNFHWSDGRSFSWIGNVAPIPSSYLSLISNPMQSLLLCCSFFAWRGLKFFYLEMPYLMWNLFLWGSFSPSFPWARRACHTQFCSCPYFWMILPWFCCTCPSWPHWAVSPGHRLNSGRIHNYHTRFL